MGMVFAAGVTLIFVAFLAALVLHTAFERGAVRRLQGIEGGVEGLGVTVSPAIFFRAHRATLKIIGLLSCARSSNIIRSFEGFLRGSYRVFVDLLR